MIRKIIKAKSTKPITEEIVGTVKETFGYIPDDSWIEYVPGRIFDRRKYSELYLTFYKDRLPTENEVHIYMLKMGVIKEKKPSVLLKLVKLLGWFLLSIPFTWVIYLICIELLFR